jgi:hypothetical protein
MKDIAYHMRINITFDFAFKPTWQIWTIDMNNFPLQLILIAGLLYLQVDFSSSV